MNSKEIITRIIEHDKPERIGHEFSRESNDMRYIAAAKFIDKGNGRLRVWGKHQALLDKVPDFRGEVCQDLFGNIYGRFEGKTKGECIKGVLQDSWDLLDDFRIPEIDVGLYAEIKNSDLKNSEKFIIAGFPLSVFSNLRDARLMGNALVDTLAEQDNVRKFLDKICERSFQIIEGLGSVGCDAIIMADDWGTQDRTFISPGAFRRVFKPVYKRIAEAIHHHKMKYILHSCGRIYEFMNDFIDAGIDVFQFDQMALYGSDLLAREFGHRAAFLSPVDIQKVLPTGDRAFIEKTAYEMVTNFKTICNGSLIVRDYPSYSDINVREEWADWARRVILDNSRI